jgi:hypothetical protein
MSLKSVIIPRSVTSVNSFAFEGCNALVKSAYPNSISNPFSNGIAISYPTDDIFIEDGIIWNADKSKIYFVPITYTGDFIIPNSVTAIKAYAFLGCTALGALTIPNSVTSIGIYAFDGCSGISEFNIEDSDTELTLGAYAFNNVNPTTVYLGRKISSTIFSGNTKLETLTIGNKVTSIDEDAFEGCKGLTTVSISNSVTSIGKGAFYNCTNLDRVNITDLEAWCGITFGTEYSNPLWYAKYLYLNNKEITELSIPNSVSAVGEYAFCRYRNLKTLMIPNSVVSVDYHAFGGCTGITEIKIEDSETKLTIGNGAFNSVNPATVYLGRSLSSSIFSGNIKLKTLTIGNKVTTIDSNYFQDCTGLTSLTMSKTLTSIGSSAFQGCSGLITVSIPNSVTSIGTSAFQSCSGLTSLTMSNSLASIGSNAFYDCSGLTTVAIPNSVTMIGDKAFSGCSNLEKVDISDLAAWCGISFSSTTSNPLYYASHFYLNGQEITELIIPDNVTSIGDYAFYNCDNLTSATIPNSVISIGQYAFYGCKGLKSVIIPSSVKSVGTKAFDGCSGLVKSAYPSSIKNPFSNGIWVSYPSDNNLIENSIIWNADKSSLYFVYYDYQGNFIIPNSVTSIGDDTFNKCSELTALTIPNSVTSIGSSAFRDCTGLTMVTIPNSVTSIGKNAFYGSTELADIKIPSSVKSIGSDAFKGIKDNARIIDSSYAISGDYSNITDGSKNIYCHSGRTYTSGNNSKITYLEDIVYPIDKVEKIRQLQFKLETISDVEVSDIIVYDSNGVAVNDNNGLYVVSDRIADIAYKLYGLDVSYEIETTAKPELSLTLVEATQSTLTVKASITNDGTMKVYELVIYPFWDYTYYPQEVQNGKPYTIDYYCPGNTYKVHLKVSTDVGEYRVTEEFTTKPLNLQIEAAEYGPCRVKYIASWDDGDAVISSYGFTDNNISSKGDGNVVYESEDGLNPSTNISLYYVITTKARNGKESGTYRVSCSSTLPELEWYENTPVATSTTSCRIMSSTNCNANVGTGFEWKRYDAPNEMAATKVSCPVVDGILVGSLRNLNPEVYYKYRPYYTSNSGATYYGDWTPFFTGDANVYFEPDVRTLADIEILSNSAILTGYVLPGSDDVQSQGFQYRKVAKQGSSQIAALNGQNAEEWINVAASGIKPTATIDGLDFDSQYEYRVYATTKTDTYYGESRYFTIESQSGIEDVAVDGNGDKLTLNVYNNPDLKIAVSGTSAETVMYEIYNVSGVHIAHGNVDADGDYHAIASDLIRGVYAVIVSDGCGIATRKVIVR